MSQSTRARLRTLEFESAHFLQSLFAHDLARLKDLEESLSVATTSRDGWLKIEGDEAQVDQACTLIEDLEKTIRQGNDISEDDFRYALEKASQGQAEKALEDLKKIRLQVSASKPFITAKTEGQYRYLKALESHDVVFGVGPAGTGKTFLAMAMALAALKAKEVNRVILTRPAVEAGEALGFLPGDLKEKIFPYLRPLYDALYDMLTSEEVERYIDRGMIEIAPLAYMRGRTLNNAVVILDEAQNTTCEQMFMFLTRLGRQSKCIVTGDLSQIDLKPKIRSGLAEAVDTLKKIEGIACEIFQAGDVIRHPVVQRIIDAYDQSRGSASATDAKPSKSEHD